MRLQVLLAATLTTAVLAGCGATPAAAPAAVARAHGERTMMVQGVERKLGFDWDRYQKQFEDQDPGQAFPRRQGLMPDRVDHRPLCGPVYDQRHLASCTAFATAKGMREFLQRKNGERLEPLSALFSYYEARKGIPLVGPILKFSDMGATVTEAMDVLREKGAAPDALWPYETRRFANKPAEAAYAAAGEFKIRKATKLRSFEDVKAALAAGGTVAFGFQTRSSFAKIGADGMMPMPKWHELPEGAHAVLAVGYDDKQERLIVRNSWGEKWGDKGYFYMPYAAAKQRLLATDWWTAE